MYNVVMKISTKGRYALRLLVDLADNQGEGFVSLKDVAKRQDISKKYLEQIVPLLTSGGILRANKGYLGGYRLAREAENVTVAEVLRVTEGGLAPVVCLEAEENYCARRAFCSTLPLWTGLKKVVNDYLQSVTIRDLSEQNKNSADNYSI